MAQSSEAGSALEAVAELFGGPGPAREQLRAVNWPSTSLGPVHTWSESLCTAVHAVLDSNLSSSLMWGPELVSIANDGAVGMYGSDSVQGRPARLVFAEQWDEVGVDLERVLRTGQGMCSEDVLLPLHRGGYVKEAFFTFSRSAVREQGRLAGVLSTSFETTERVLARRRLELLRGLSAAALGATSERDVSERMLGVLGKETRDVPFALLYLTEPQERATLAAVAGVPRGSSLAPPAVSLRDMRSGWPIGAATIVKGALEVHDLAERFPDFYVGPWPEPPTSALLVPLRAAAQPDEPLGVLVLGVSARRELDEACGTFFTLVAASIAAAIADVGAHQRELARRALRSTEERYRSLFESIHEGFCTIEVMFNQKGDAYDYRFLETNPAFVRETGFESAVGQTMRSLAPGHEAFWFKVYGRVATTGEPARFRHAAVQLGKLYDVYAFRIGEPSLRHVAVLFHDVSEPVSRLERAAENKRT